MVLRESTSVHKRKTVFSACFNKSLFLCTKPVNFAKIFSQMIYKMLYNNKLKKT